MSQGPSDSGKIETRDIVFREIDERVEKLREMMKPRVIELGDRNSRLALRRQLKLDFSSPDKSDDGKQSRKSEDRESMEILQKLPPGTVLIKHLEAPDFSEESEKKSDMLERPKRISQRVRNKNKTIEVRRNPMRVTKKEMEKNRASMRQRLLAARRKNSVTTSETQKRSKHYMNTRSVTRKMYNVGATYQAPTKRDETEWKEWPVHGMHERPVYHPQVGLASEYNGRLFVSLNDQRYQEVPTGSNVEVVSVDPRRETSDRISNKELESGINDESKLVEHGVNRNLYPSNSSSRIPNSTCLKSTTDEIAQTLNREHNQQTGKLVGTCSIGNNAPNPQNLHGNSNSLSNLQHLEQIRNAKKLQYYENLQKFSSSLRFQNYDKAVIANGKFVKNDVAMQIQNSNYFNLKNPSKCLILPRGAAINLSNLRDQLQSSVPGNTKNALILVSAPDASKAAKTSNADKPATVTSSSVTERRNEINLKMLKDATISDETRLEVSTNYEKKKEEAPFLHADVEWIKSSNLMYGPQNSKTYRAISTDQERQDALHLRQLYGTKNASQVKSTNEILRILSDYNRGFQGNVPSSELHGSRFPNQRRYQFGEKGEFSMNVQERVKVSDEYRLRDDVRNEVLSPKCYAINNRGVGTYDECLPEALDLSKKETSKALPAASNQATDSKRNEKIFIF